MIDRNDSPEDEAPDLTALPPAVFAELFGKPLTEEGRRAIDLGAALRAEAAKSWAEEAEFRRSGPFRTLADLAARDAGLDPGGVPLAVVPANRKPLAPLPEPRRQAFLRHLEALVGTLRTEPSEADVLPDTEQTPVEAAPEAEQRMCSACRGWCCEAGGEHAYLDAQTLRRACRSRGDSSLDDLRERYRAALPDSSVEGSCVFHGESGCTLDRSLRSDTCNDTICGGLKHFRQTPGAGEARRVFIVAARGNEPVRTELTDLK